MPSLRDIKRFVKKCPNMGKIGKAWVSELRHDLTNYLQIGMEGTVVDRGRCQEDYRH